MESCTAFTRVKLRICNLQSLFNSADLTATHSRLWCIRVMLFVSSLQERKNSLTRLSLARNEIRLPGATALASFLLGNQTLCALSLTFNPLGDCI